MQKAIHTKAIDAKLAMGDYWQEMQEAAEEQRLAEWDQYPYMEEQDWQEEQNDYWQEMLEEQEDEYWASEQHYWTDDWDY